MEQIRVELTQQRTSSGFDGPEQPRENAGSLPLRADEIMARVRAEVGRRRTGNIPAAAEAPAGRSFQGSRVERLPRWAPAAFRLPEQGEYTLSDFLRFDDADFIDVVYQTLLRRPPDPKGSDGYLDALRSGALSKVEILGNIRFSEEGRRQGVHVDGLLLPYKLHRWRHLRVFGWFLGMGMAVWRLPRLAWRLQGMEASAAHESQQAGRVLAQLADGVDRHFANLGEAIDRLRDELTQSVTSRVEGVRVVAARVGALQAVVESASEDLRAKHAELEHKMQQGLAGQDARRTELIRTLDGSVSELRGKLEAIADSLNSVEDKHASKHAELLESLAAIETRRMALAETLHASNTQWLRERKELANRLSVYDAALARLDEQTQEDQRNVRAMLQRLTVFLEGATENEKYGGARRSDEAAIALEAQYASFERTFRGDREQIKQRAAHYLETLAAAGILPSDGGVVLDLGSGRGEWLEVLAEHGYHGRGVDLNQGMLQESETRGHEVVEADALEYLRAQETASVTAITSMHLVEHISHPVLIQLLDEALRVLRPGGVLILETPNPENVLVGSCMFYMDPTHLNPIPPPLLQWVVQARGFEQASIERLSEHRGAPDLKPVSDAVPGANQINQMVSWFTAPPDYAVIARKPAIQ
jgi:SAM-dependent methyltransferase